MRYILLRFQGVRIRTRLLIFYIGMLLIGLAIMTLFAGRQISTAGRADYEQHLRDEVQLAAQSIGMSLVSQYPGQVGATEVALAIRDHTDPNVGSFVFFPPPKRSTVSPGSNSNPPAVSNPDMNPTLGPDPNSMSGPNPDSNPTPGPGMMPPPPPRFGLPELDSARNNVITVAERKNAQGVDTFYTAAPVITTGPQQFGLLQLAVPASTLQEALIRQWSMLGIGFAILIVLASLAALLLSRSLIRPLYRLRDSALRLSQGDLSHRVALAGRDEITDVGRTFNLMATQVQAMLDEQKAFASNTAHELRTPLTAMRLRTQALRDDSSLDIVSVQQYIREIDDDVVHLSNLVQDLTVLSLFDAGRAEVGHEEIDLLRLAKSLMEQIQMLTYSKRLQIQLSIPETPIYQIASQSHLTIVFRNLLDNAIKYTPNNGTITWTIDTNEHGVIHTIQDCGQGIAPEHLPKLFTRFYRADAARSRDIPGTGLGLTLVRAIITAYQGNITIESAGVGLGTTVRVFWPFHHPQQIVEV